MTKKEMASLPKLESVKGLDISKVLDIAENEAKEVMGTNEDKYK